MLMLEPLQDKHFWDFFPIDIQEKDYETVREMFYGTSSPHNFCYTYDGVPVLMTGVKEKWLGVYDTYTIFGKNWKPIYYRQVIRDAKYYFDKLKYDRIEHLISCDREWTDKMARAFGFKFVAKLRKYIDGKDYKLYEMVG